jgi:peptidoglycan/xylan/chitin deacetylase (PgdA/CDA1 family)
VRRRRSRRRRGLAVLALLLVLAAIIAGVAAATSVDPPPPSKRVVAPPGKPRHFTGVPRRPAGARAGTIARTLSYTPFVTHASARRRAIALTFDDGPGSYTGQVVSVLSRLHAPATFFIVGQQLPLFAAGVRDELRHGFEIGNHTQNHAWLIRLAAAQQYAQIHGAAVALERLGVPAPTLFRPPYGALDQRTLAVLRRLHMLAVLWSVDPGDWRRPGTRAIVRAVLDGARPGAIVELHDGGGNRSETVAALPAIVTGLRRRHYQLVTVAQLLALAPPDRRQRLPGVGYSP